MTDCQHFGTILEKLCIEGIFLQQKVSGSLRTINQKNLIAMGKQNLPKHNTVKCLTKQTWYWPILISSQWLPTSLSDHMNAQKKSASYLFLWTNWPLSKVFKKHNHPLYVGLERNDKTWSGASFCSFPTVGMHWLTLQSWAFPSISFGSPLGGVLQARLHQNGLQPFCKEGRRGPSQKSHTTKQKTGYNSVQSKPHSQHKNPPPVPEWAHESDLKEKFKTKTSKH